MKMIWKKITRNKKRALMIAAGVLVLAAVIAALCLLLRDRPEAPPVESPTAAPTATLRPSPTAQPVTPSPTPEPMITPPALEPGDVASTSDIQVDIQQPSTESDLAPVG